MAYYWRCPVCGGYSEMAKICGSCEAKKRSLPAATEQTSGIKNAKKTLADYTTHKEGMSSA